ncbi:MAG: hypothetical protein GY930_00370 [bacterium]|nr:hypothetical protein [bacterium]
MKYSKAEALLEALSQDELQDEFYSIRTPSGHTLPELDPSEDLVAIIGYWSHMDDTSITLPSGRILKPQEATQYPAPVVTHPVFKAPRISVTFESRQVGPDAFTFRFSGTVFGKTFKNRKTSFPFFRFHQERETQRLESLAWNDLDLSGALSSAGRKALAPALAAIYRELL